MANLFGFQLSRVRKDGLAIPPTNATNNAPPEVEQALHEQGMDPVRPFSPGRPLPPYFGYSQDPRAYNFQTGENITTRPRLRSQVSFETLRAVFANYDVAKICLHHRIASFRSFDWAVTPKPGESGDLTAAVLLGTAKINKLDGKTPYKSFVAKAMKDLLRYDAMTLHRRRDRAGRVIGLEVVDGSSIAPLIDEYGRRPDAPAPAFIQYVNGVPWDWLTEQDLIYEPYWPSSDTEYGEAPLEGVLMNANTDMRFGQHLLEYWTEGSIPGMFAEAPEGMDNPAQIDDLQDSWDARVQGDQAKKVGVEWVPHGSNFKEYKEGKFDEPLALWSMRKTCAAMGVVPQDVGLTADINKATGEVQMDIQERIGDRPLALHMDSILTAYLQDDCGLPVVMTTSLGAEKEDRVQEAQAWSIYIDKGMASADEGRAQILGLPIDNERPVPRFIFDTRIGPVPLTSLFAIAGQVDPETAAPTEEQALADDQFAGAPGTIPDKLPGGVEFKRAPVNPDDPRFPANEQLQPDTGTVQPAPLALPVAKAETAGINSDTGIVGYDLAGGKPEDEDDPEEVAKELRRWRDNARGRIKAGRRPRQFASERISAARSASIWADLEGASTRAEVDKAFTSRPLVRKAQATAQRQRLTRAAEYYAERIHLYQGLDAQAIAQGWSAKSSKVTKAVDPTEQTDAERAAAREYAQGLNINSGLADILPTIYAEGYTIGAQGALDALVGKLTDPKGISAVPINWAQWAPGNPEAAAHLAQGGLADLLSQADITIKGIDSTALDRVGNILADGAQSGSSVDTIAGSLQECFDSPSKAEQIASTELNRAVSRASLDTYGLNGVPGKSWGLGPNPCTACEDNAGDGAIALGDDFSSGDQAPPGHPFCECDLMPETAVDGASAATADGEAARL